MAVRSRNVDGSWVIEADALPPGLAPAVGYWLDELGATAIDAQSNSVRATASDPEPIVGALAWLVGEIERGRPPFEALGFAAAHLDGAEVRSGREVLIQAAGQSDEVPDADPDVGNPSANRRLESIGDNSSVPLDSQMRTDPVAGEVGAPPPAVEPGRRKSHRDALEPIGYDPEALRANLDASVAAADTLPEADAPGSFDLHLISAGYNSSRTAAMLGAALGIDIGDAMTLCDACPTQVGTALPAREVRRVDAIVRPATGAEFSAAPSSLR